MKNSKKIVAIALALVMLVGGVIAGTMAWFTDDESAVNTVVVGDVGILLHESNGTVTDDEYRTWLANQWLLPSTGNDDNQIAKQVTVENNSSNDAYVRVKIYVPTDIADVIHFNQSNTDWTALKTADDKANAKTGEKVVNGVNCVEYTLYYLKATDGVLKGNNNADVNDADVAANAKTSNAIDSIYLDKYVDCDNVPGAITYWYKGTQKTELDDGMAKITVVAEAIQDAGFAGVDAAWAEFDTQTTNKWNAEAYTYYADVTSAPAEES